MTKNTKYRFQFPCKKVCCTKFHNWNTTTDITKNISYETLERYGIPWSQVVCRTYTPEAQRLQACGLKVYLSGEPQLQMV